VRTPYAEAIRISWPAGLVPSERFALMSITDLADADAAVTCLTFQPGMSLRPRQILRVSLRLFSEREYAAVSLRDIATEAAVSLTLIDHHFGAKHALFASVVRSWAPTFEQAALEMRHALAQGRLTNAADLIALMLRPIDKLLAEPDGANVLGLCARHRNETDPAIGGPMGLALGPYRLAIGRALERLHPTLGPDETDWGVSFALAALFEFAASTTLVGLRPHRGGTMASERQAARDLLARHIAGGWCAGLDG